VLPSREEGAASNSAAFPWTFRLHFAPETSTDKAFSSSRTCDFQLAELDVLPTKVHSPERAVTFWFTCLCGRCREGISHRLAAGHSPAEPLGPGNGRVICTKECKRLCLQAIVKENIGDFIVKDYKTILHVF